jgi:hypothetical protein
VGSLKSDRGPYISSPTNTRIHKLHVAAWGNSIGQTGTLHGHLGVARDETAFSAREGAFPPSNVTTHAPISIHSDQTAISTKWDPSSTQGVVVANINSSVKSSFSEFQSCNFRSLDRDETTPERVPSTIGIRLLTPFTTPPNHVCGSGRPRQRERKRSPAPDLVLEVGGIPRPSISD